MKQLVLIFPKNNKTKNLKLKIKKNSKLFSMIFLQKRQYETNYYSKSMKSIQNILRRKNEVRNLLSVNRNAFIVVFKEKQKY